MLSLATIYSFAAPKFLTGTAYAAGDLTIDWGVPTGDPIFVVENMLPGDQESRVVEVTNNATISRQVAIRGVKTLETLNFSTVIDFVIKKGVTDIYGGTSATGAKTLKQFFQDSGAPQGLPLANLAPSQTETFTFIATFDQDAGNEFQNAKVVFDLIIGVSAEIPADCQNINIDGQVITGTQNKDNLKGTNKNDLIIALEGDDKVDASNGDDCIIGGPGKDKLDGSNGKDIIFGNDGDDYIDGSNGDDYINGGAGNDKISGGTNGNDQIFAEDGNDEVDASNGDDYVILGAGNDKADGGNGNDYIEGNEGNDEMKGGNGNDKLLGGAGTDKAWGELGSDTCEAETKFTCEL